MSHAVFDVVAENPQVEHIPQKMKPAPVQKHRGEQGNDEIRKLDASLIVGAEVEKVFVGLDGKLVKEPLKLPFGQQQLKGKRPGIRHNDAKGDKWEAARWHVIVNRNHRACFSLRSVSVTPFGKTLWKAITFCFTDWPRPRANYPHARRVGNFILSPGCRRGSRTTQLPA